MMPSLHSRSLTGGGRPTPRELEVLCALIASGKTTAAALQLGISQPAVSRAIAALERRLGRALFHREGGRLVATAHALALNAEAAPLLAALERLAAWPSATSETAALRLAAPPTIAHAFLPELIQSFLSAEPNARLHMEIGKTVDVVVAVAEGTADLGFTDTAVEHSGVSTEPFRRAIGHVALPRGHALCARRTLAPADLAAEPIIALTRRFPSRAQLDRAFLDAGVQPRIVAEVATAVFAASLVERGCGLAILNPFPLALDEAATVEFRPFAPAIGYETSFVLPAGAPATPLARRFADFVRREQTADPFTTPLR